MKKFFLSIVASLHNYSFGRKMKAIFPFPSSLIIIIIVSLFVATNFVFAVAIPQFGPTSWSGLFESITKVVSDVIGSIAGIMFIVAGIIYLTSAGDPERMNLAKKALTYAIIGLIVAIAAGSIVKMITTATGT